MPRLRTLLTASILLITVAPAALALEPGLYSCMTRNGQESGARRFIVDGEGGTRAPDGSGAGAYTVQGHNIYFRGGALDGHQVLALPGGALKVSGNVFCEKIAAAPEPVRAAPAPEPAPARAPAAKLIKIKPD